MNYVIMYLRNYNSRSFWTFQSVSALFLSRDSSSGFRFTFTMSVMPFLPKIQGTLRKISSLIPYKP